MADFTPSPPAFRIFIADAEGNINFKKATIAVWPKTKDDGTEYYVGKVDGTDRRVVMYKNEPKPAGAAPAARAQAQDDSDLPF